MIWTMNQRKLKRAKRFSFVTFLNVILTFAWIFSKKIIIQSKRINSGISPSRLLFWFYNEDNFSSLYFDFVCYFYDFKEREITEVNYNTCWFFTCNLFKLQWNKFFLFNIFTSFYAISDQFSHRSFFLAGTD